MIIPHSRFVDYQDRRHKAVQPVRLDGPRGIGPEHPIGLPRVHIAGSNPYYDAHVEVADHGVALFLTPDAAAPVLDIEGTWDELDAVVSALQAALVAKRIRAATTKSDPVQIVLPHAALGTESDE